MEPSPSNKYDYIFTGAGCAGLSLLMHLIDSGKFSDKKILLIDQSPKTGNDRTWCFWETKPGLFESITAKQWSTIAFYADGVSREMDISPYTYKMIRGIDFYRYCLDTIKAQPNITLLQVPVEAIEPNDTSVLAGGQVYHGKYIFNSILFKKPVLKGNEFYLNQHFRGWMIETARPVFNPSMATLMDFRVSQHHGTTFTYVLPLTGTKAMVEYTLFTKDLLDSEEYNKGLKQYIDTFIRSDYEVTEVENGVIPMTNHRFARRYGNIINIGSAGGMTKPSSGYTFYFIQRHSRAITKALISTGKPFVRPVTPGKYDYFDSVLLNVLSTGKMPGHQVFSKMFERNKPAEILQFLNNESSLATDLRIISSLPFRPFLLAGLQELF